MILLKFCQGYVQKMFTLYLMSSLKLTTFAASRQTFPGHYCSN